MGPAHKLVFLSTKTHHELKGERVEFPRYLLGKNTQILAWKRRV